MASIIPNAVTHFDDNNGNPLAGGQVFFYIPNTSTLKNTYQDKNQTILNTNPVILDSRGEAVIWGSGTYRQVVKDSDGNLIWDRITEDPNSGLTGNMTDDLFVAGTDFTPGTTTVLTLSAGAGSITNTWIYFDGVYQADDQIASLDGVTLTFSSPIPVGVSLVTVKIGSTISIGTPSIGTVTDASVAANAGIQSTKLSYRFQATGAVTRTGYSKFSDWISVKDFGAVGDGVSDDTAAFSAAITYANSLNPNPVDAPNVIGITILIPNGRYNIAGAVTPILKGSIAIVGESRAGVKLLLSYNGPTFTWNTTGSADLVVNGEFSNCAVEYLAAPPSNAMIWYLEQTYRVHFENIDLINVNKVAQIGSPTRAAGAIYFTNIVGYVANQGQSAFITGTGAGLFFDSCRIFVPVPTPAPNRTSTMTTLPGTNFLTMNSGSWDTVQFNNCFIERFYFAIYLSASSGIIINNIYIANTYFDYIANRVLFAESLSTLSGGVFGVKMTGCWIACWDDTAVYLHGPGALRVFEFSNCNIVSAGAYGYLIDGAQQVQIETGIVAGTNRLVASNAAAIAFNSGSKLTVNGVNAGFDSTLDGFPWQATYGFAVSADLDYYTVTSCEFAGSIGPVSLPPNAAGSQNRIIKNNRGTNFQNTVTTPSMTTGVPFVNTLPYMIRFNTFGGTVSGISLNGNGINGATSGQFILNPGDSITVTYSVAPSFSYSGIN